MQMTLCYATCVGKAANCIYPNKVVVDNAADMESAVAVDHVCATYTGNRRGNSNFIESDVIPMDIDNDHVQEYCNFLLHLHEMMDHCHFAYTEASEIYKRYNPNTKFSVQTSHSSRNILFLGR